MTQRRPLWITLAAASFVAALVAPRVSFALHAQSPPVTQVTQQTTKTVDDTVGQVAGQGPVTDAVDGGSDTVDQTVGTVGDTVDNTVGGLTDALGGGHGH